MNKLKTIIIDDELDAIAAIESILNIDCDQVEVLDSFSNPKDALKAIDHLNPDCIFLDIEMPGMNGFEFLGALNNPQFEVIFVTAYHEYAIEAIKNNALDYILKPIRIEDTIQAIEKVRKKKQNNNSSTDQYLKLLQNINFSQPKRIKVPTGNGFEIVEIDNICRIEASGAYSVLIIKNGEQIVLSKTIKDIEHSLTSHEFYRVHRSHLINLKHVKRFNGENDGTITMTDNVKIPLSRRKRADFISAIENTF